VHSRIPTESDVDLKTWGDEGGRKGERGRERKGEEKEGVKMMRGGEHAEIGRHWGLGRGGRKACECMRGVMTMLGR
jgi:hypothetical protein